MRGVGVLVSTTAMVVITSACGGSDGGGVVVEPPPPTVTLTPRYDHSMVYDEARRQVLLFGGWGAEGTSPVGDRASTWAWNGTTWTRLATTGPSARHDASMVYDAARQRVVLFGGRVGAFPNETVLSDTWEWNGTSWARVADSGPGARVHVSMTYDRARSRVVLYGGFEIPTQTEFRDIWEWNGTAWARQSASTPATVLARGAAYDEKTSTLYLISATATTGAMVMHSWNGTSLTAVTAAPPSCSTTIVSLGPTRGGFLQADWCEGSGRLESWRWTGTAWSSVTGAQPSPRGGHDMAYDRDRDRVVLFGGATVPGGAALGDTWEFDGTAWAQK